MERGEVERRERMVNTEGSVYYNSSKIMIKIEEKMLMSFDKVPWNPPWIIIPSFLTDSMDALLGKRHLGAPNLPLICSSKSS